MSAATIVAPVPPCTAIPTSASARAAASFTPSPTITTAPARPARRHEAGDDVPLRLRGEAAERVVGRQAELGADAGDDGGVVAGEDPDADASGAKGRDGPPGVRAERVPDAGDAGDASVDGDEDRAEAVGDDRLGEPGEVGGNAGPLGLDVGPVPDADVVAVEPAGDPLSRDLDHVLDRSHDPHGSADGAPEGAGHGVRRLRLEGPRELRARRPRPASAPPSPGPR